MSATRTADGYPTHPAAEPFQARVKKWFRSLRMRNPDSSSSRTRRNNAQQHPNAQHDPLCDLDAPNNQNRRERATSAAVTSAPAAVQQHQQTACCHCRLQSLPPDVSSTASTSAGSKHHGRRASETVGLETLQRIKDGSIGSSVTGQQSSCPSSAR